jgi:HD-GYP domain-containing protein (c-di-GMP phosphodiesterase class II)
MTEPSTVNKYIAISKDALVENTKIEFDVFLRNDQNGRSRYILFCRGNQAFSSERKGELLNRNTQRLYIAAKDTSKYIRYQENNLKQIVEDSSKTSLQKSGALYQVARNLAQDVLDDPYSGENIERASEWVGNTISHIFQNKNTFSSLFEVASHDYHTTTHSINTSVTGLLFGKYLSLAPHELECLGIGLLLHDIGKSKISQELLNKKQVFTDEDFLEIKKHPKAGLDILDLRDDVDGLSLKVVIQHHENNDGTGYPYGIGGSDIHLFGHIARIVDAYDAMTSDRPYAAAMKPFATLAEIGKENRICFNGELLKEFIYFLGLKDPRSKSRVHGTISTS